MFSNLLFIILSISTIVYLLLMSRWRIHHNIKKMIDETNKQNKIGYENEDSMTAQNSGTTDDEGFIGSSTVQPFISGISNVVAKIPFEIKMKNKHSKRAAYHNKKVANSSKKKTITKEIISTLVDLPRNVMLYY